MAQKLEIHPAGIIAIEPRLTEPAACAESDRHEATLSGFLSFLAASDTILPARESVSRRCRRRSAGMASQARPTAGHVAANVQRLEAELAEQLRRLRNQLAVARQSMD